MRDPAALARHREGVMTAAHQGLYPQRSLKALEEEYRTALRMFMLAHELLYAQQVNAGILGDPRYSEPTIPNDAYLAQVEAYEHARELLD